MKTPNQPYLNAQEMHKEHPDTFEAPTLEQLNDVKVRDHVKVCVGQERFWVIVTAIPMSSAMDSNFTGIVDNILVFTQKHGINYEDEINFGKENVLSITTTKTNQMEKTANINSQIGTIVTTSIDKVIAETRLETTAGLADIFSAAAVADLLTRIQNKLKDAIIPQTDGLQIDAGAMDREQMKRFGMYCITQAEKEAQDAIDGVDFEDDITYDLETDENRNEVTVRVDNVKLDTDTLSREVSEAIEAVDIEQGLEAFLVSDAKHQAVVNPENN